MAAVRIDKYLWAVRLFKTRTIATDACRRGKISVAGKSVKPSFMLNVGERFEIRKGPALFSFKVVAIPTGRVGAKLVKDYLLDTTPHEQLDLLNVVNENNGFRAKGLGRPTKKERRDLTEFAEEMYMFDSFFSEDI